MPIVFLTSLVLSTATNVMLLFVLWRKARAEAPGWLFKSLLLSGLVLQLSVILGLVAPQLLPPGPALRISSCALLLLIVVSSCTALRVLFQRKRPGKSAVSMAVLCGIFAWLAYLAIRDSFFSGTIASTQSPLPAVYLTETGRWIFALLILLTFFYLARIELFWQGLYKRFGYQGRIAALCLLISILAALVFFAWSMVFWEVHPLFGTLLFATFSAFGISLSFAIVRTGHALPAHRGERLRLPYAAGSAALIYGGIYLITFGLLVKFVIWIGGDWQVFISFLAAIGAAILALMLISNHSLRLRWQAFVDRNLLERQYDFREELHQLCEALVESRSIETLCQRFCETLAKTFQAEKTILLLQSNGPEIFDLHVAKSSRLSMTELRITCREQQWLLRTQGSFAVSRFLAGIGESSRETLTEFAAFLRREQLEWGVCLYAGRKLMAMTLLGGLPSARTFREEQRQLLDLMVTLISLELHRSRLQESLRASEQMESIYRITSFLMHDLRNIASTLSLLHQNAHRHLEKKTFRQDFIRTLGQISREMAHLMDRLTHIDTASMKGEFEVCAPDELLRNLLREIQIPDRITLHEHIEPLSQAMWNRRQIRVVLRNIILNAIEAMPEGGDLCIQAQAQDHRIIYTISDSGHGMSREFIRRSLFRPGATTKAKGLGIGMYQSREIVHQHHGSITVKSTPGRGTVLRIELPLHSPGSCKNRNGSAR